MQYISLFIFIIIKTRKSLDQKTAKYLNRNDQNKKFQTTVCEKKRWRKINEMEKLVDYKEWIRNGTVSVSIIFKSSTQYCQDCLVGL